MISQLISILIFRQRDVRPPEVTTQHHVKLRLGGMITLVVGDRGAIWRAHNEEYADDFDALFTFLAHYPSQAVRFLCEITR